MMYSQIFKKNTLTVTTNWEGFSCLKFFFFFLTLRIKAFYNIIPAFNLSQSDLLLRLHIFHTLYGGLAIVSCVLFCFNFIE